MRTEEFVMYTQCFVVYKTLIKKSLIFQIQFIKTPYQFNIIFRKKQKCLTNNDTKVNLTMEKSDNSSNEKKN